MNNMTEKRINVSRAAAASLFCVLLAAVLLAFILVPDKAFSDFEKRALTGFPSLTLDSLLDGSFESGLETYMQDQFPSRNLFVGIGSYFDAATGRNGVDGVYHRDGYFINEPVAYNAETLYSNLGILKDFAQASELDAYMMVVPSAGFILNDKLPRVHKTYKDGEIIDDIYKTVTGSLKTVDLCDIYKQNAGEMQLYYKTDHHWTSGGAYLAYDEFMKAAGLTSITAERFSVYSVGGFYGTTYAKAALWLATPDTMALWRVDGSRFSIQITDTGKQPVVSDSLFYESHLKENDMYEVYLDGNHGLTVITNKNAASGSLLLLKDSYANTLATMLANVTASTAMALQLS